METFDAILPAGGTIPSEFAGQVGTNSKALIEIAGKTMLERTLTALRESGLVARTALIGGDGVLSHPSAQSVDYRVKEGSTGPENIFKGLDALAASGNPSKRVLLVTCDLPFLTPQLVKDFVAGCTGSHDFCVPLVGQESFGQRFPGTSATFVTLKDGVWTTGCLYRIEVQSLRKARPHIEKVFENRKSKFGMAKLLGPKFVVKYLMKSLTVSEVEKKIESLLGCTAKAIVGSAPEFSFDIDYLDDYEYAVKWCSDKELQTAKA